MFDKRLVALLPIFRTCEALRIEATPMTLLGAASVDRIIHPQAAAPLAKLYEHILTTN